MFVSEGGRLSSELAYTLKWLGEGSGTTYELLIQTPRGRRSGADVEGGTRSVSNVLTVRSMLQHLEAVRAATTLSVELFDVYVPAYTIYIHTYAARCQQCTFAAAAGTSPQAIRRRPTAAAGLGLT